MLNVRKNWVPGSCALIPAPLQSLCLTECYACKGMWRNRRHSGSPVQSVISKVEPRHGQEFDIRVRSQMPFEDVDDSLTPWYVHDLLLYRQGGIHHRKRCCKLVSQQHLTQPTAAAAAKVACSKAPKTSAGSAATRCRA